MLRVGLLVAVAVSAQCADLPQAKAILEKFRSSLPRDEDLAIYRLDWAASLADAKIRAAREQRPIFLLAVLNSYGNLYSGHC